MAGALESMVVDEKQLPEKPVDREKVNMTCPLLLRVFCNTGRHHNIMEYSRGNVPSNELQIYTWMDATLREITGLVKEVNPDARSKGTYFDFSLVTPELRNSGYRMREIGVTCSGQKGADDNKTLAQARFTIGDYLDISITPPNRMMQPAARRGGLRQY
ncbi:PREDICTED: histone deacetylase complex subunit SAP18 isoform X1 [Wasmannia auropunctata]|uniref:histone deacetylase complex subunit SAP18 isoform X1 n=1 Tax=Wasmannia auropunctata TaxID=64793 RepID=UPI0005EE5DEC|nr:PREDICTED: histone deacetylase complex subunit SAP18 isoform X1 [Wasmannia auropunctata]XP_011690144.1 PREDICTED: histone deacetylase complex subunit SAP18 isoform X1 [Wasmannia auropunctata]XP_011690145.1 PREDICTED: histone deacetylase complex subunit SAP18 isoform X1 [Wasmannia auropunctata]XP_011690147.1 PREDICTED: histone deacetylase complex subunit SAP18 isoform X1 [Wasmannia auropunctata]XP_011690148.1 PREDICTED: histone deacetylase complex subunit SAP18 isoform X1 [Wasmannia auropunct